MLEYRRASLTRALQAKGYQRFAIRSFRVFGQVSWQVDLYDHAGTVVSVLGGPAATYAAVLAHIAALPPATSRDGPG
jgi:hypothetical protein